MDFRILGSLEVEHEGRLIPLDGIRQRALLALLLLHANTSVPREVLIDGLWRTNPPASAAHTLDVYISRIRRALQTDGASVLETRAGSYVMHVDPEDLDLNRFTTLLSEGQAQLAAGDFERASGTLRAALDEWRGDALADLRSEPFAVSHAEWLDELRLCALEELFEAELTLGREAEIVGELEFLVAAYPLREHLRRQLMLALYRAGRQAEALAVYHEGWELLVNQLGIEPSNELRQLERAILRQDPAIAASGDGTGLPTKRAAARLRELVARGPSLLAGDPGASVREFVRAGVELSRDDGSFPVNEAVEPLLGDLLELADRLVARAQSHQTLREDVSGADLIVLQKVLREVALTLRDPPNLWERYLDLTLEGLRPAAGRALSQPPPSRAALVGQEPCGKTAAPNRGLA